MFQVYFDFSDVFLSIFHLLQDDSRMTIWITYDNVESFTNLNSSAIRGHLPLRIQKITYPGSSWRFPEMGNPKFSRIN